MAQLIAAHHAHLSPVIAFEEQRLLAHFDCWDDPADTQTFVERAVQTLRFPHQNLANAIRAWVQRMTPRQYRPLWGDERLAALWVMSHLRELQAGEPVTPPEGLDLFRANWLLAPVTESKNYTLRQRGQYLWLDADDAPLGTTGLSSAGSPLGHLRAAIPYIDLQRFEAHRLPDHGFLQPVDQPFLLTPQTRLRIRTDGHELVIDNLTRPDWAEAIGRDEKGLFVAWRGETQRAYWINPGPYPVYDRTGHTLGQLQIPKGYWRREAEGLAQLREGFCQPSWAEDYGLDDYGLYASFRIAGVDQQMRWIVPGEFTMGSPEDEAERYEDESQHGVILSQGFWLADTACTQALWQAVMGDNPSRFKGLDRPVESISWDAIQDFLSRLNQMSRDGGFRLPTEAEWEYACRAGSPTAFWFGDQITPTQVNYDGNYPYGGGEAGHYREETVTVKSLPCNGWGLYEMHGNVLEWCQDWYGNYPAETLTDPTGPTKGVYRVLRGGGWLGGGRDARSACRSADAPGDRNVFAGFRLARGQAASP